MKLQPLLTEYLYQNGNVSLPGTGRLAIQQAAAQIDEAGASLKAPTSTFLFEQDEEEGIDENLFRFVSERLQLSLYESQVLVGQEGSLKTVITDAAVEWPALGTFRKGAGGEIFFEKQPFLQSYLPAIPLAPVQPQKEFTIEEETPQVVDEPIQEFVEPVPQSRWWIGAIILFIVSILLILFHYLSGNGQ